MARLNGWQRAATPLALIALGACLVAADRADAQQLPQPVPGASGALLPNGGFDVADRTGHPIGWAVLGAADDVSVVNVQADRTAGLGSLKIADTGGEGVSVLSDRIVATVGRQYTVHADLLSQSGTPPHLSLRFYDFNKNVLDTKMVAPAAGSGWQTVTATGVAPPDTAQVSVIISTAAAGTSYWDAMQLTASQPAYDPALGSARELFLDDYRIASAGNVGRVVHPASKRPAPVLRPDKPWENSAYIYGSVYKIGGVYRMWYTATNDVSPGYFLCYAESTDGINWTKPDVGTVGYHDIPASQTNIVLPGGGTVAYNPDAPPDRRYAALTFITGTVNDTLGYYAFFSPDGYHWTQAQQKPVLLDGDVSNVTWDPQTHRYIASIKKRMFTSRTPGIYDRSAFVATSSDFLHWSTPQLAVSGDYADDGAAESIGGLEGQIYGMPVVPYESTYIGLPWVFSITDYTTGGAATAGDGPIEPEIASSRDLADWSRPDRSPVLVPGEPGAWDDGTLYTASDVLVDPSTVTIYYGGFNVWHGGKVAGDPSRSTQVGQVGVATWRRDGFVSLTNAAADGAGDPGQVTTKPVTFTGNSLHVNADVHASGSLTVEVLDPATGQPIPGYAAQQAVPVAGDRLDAQVRWTGGMTLAGLDGRQVQFRFNLTGTDLYSYWVS